MMIVIMRGFGLFFLFIGVLGEDDGVDDGGVLIDEAGFQHLFVVAVAVVDDELAGGEVAPVFGADHLGGVFGQEVGAVDTAVEGDVGEFGGDHVDVGGDGAFVVYFQVEVVVAAHPLEALLDFRLDGAGPFELIAVFAQLVLDVVVVHFEDDFVGVDHDDVPDGTAGLLQAAADFEGQFAAGGPADEDDGGLEVHVLHLADEFVDERFVGVEGFAFHGFVEHVEEVDGVVDLVGQAVEVEGEADHGGEADNGVGLGVVVVDAVEAGVLKGSGLLATGDEGAVLADGGIVEQVFEHRFDVQFAADVVEEADGFEGVAS